MQRQEAHAHPEPDPRRPRGQEPGQHRRRRAEAIVIEVMLGDPHRLVAERLGGEHLREIGLVHGLLAPLLVALHEEEEAEVHAQGRLSFRSS